MISLLMPPRAARPIAGRGDQMQQPMAPTVGGPATAPGLFNYSGASPAANLGSLLPQNPAVGPAPVQMAGQYSMPAPKPAPAMGSGSGTLLSSLLSRLRRGSYNAF